MISSHRRRFLALFVLVFVLGLDGRLALAQSRRVDPGARDILSHRLTADALRKFLGVTRTMEQLPPPPPEGSRPDIALIAVLAMGWAYNEPWKDATVAEMTRTLDAGHYDLATAIRRAGFTTREYVPTTMTLMLVHPVVEPQRAGALRGMPADVSADNLLFVEQHWSDVDRVMNDLSRAMREQSGC